VSIAILRQHVLDEIDSTLSRIDELKKNIQAQKDSVTNDESYEEYDSNWFVGLQDLNDAVREAERVMRRVLR
jgi:hypothetical protein